MRSIRRRQGRRTCSIGGEPEVAEVKGGGVPVILGDTLPYVRGRAGSRGRYSIAGHRKSIAEHV